MTAAAELQVYFRRGRIGAMLALPWTSEMINMRTISHSVLFLVLVGVTAISENAQASDAYFVGFEARGQGSIVWRDNILLYNSGPAPAAVRFVDVSNGGAPAPSPLTLVVTPGRTVSISDATGDTWRARQLPPVPLWVLHLDVPDGVIVESRNAFFESLKVEPFLIQSPRGKVSMPVIRQLTPAGQPQVHIGTDLGGPASRINVILFNAGTEVATATIEVRRACDDAVVDSRVLTVPANTAIQTAGLAATTSLPASSDCPVSTSLSSAPWARNTFVTMSQPGFSIVSNVNENVAPPTVPGTVPIVGLGVEHNARF